VAGHQGWYPDPSDPGRERLWTGRSWTAAVRDAGGFEEYYSEPLPPRREIPALETASRTYPTFTQSPTAWRVFGTIFLVLVLVGSFWLGLVTESWWVFGGALLAGLIVILPYFALAAILERIR
jgi:hypothetical protein